MIRYNAPPNFLKVILMVMLISIPSFSSEVYFSPKGGTRDQIIKRINLSKSSIDIAVYSFTSGEIADALAQAKGRGVKIRVIRDHSQSSNKNDENEFLKKNGIEIQIRSGKGRGIMHHKFAVFDGKEVITGSYNWTNNAEYNNYENALFLGDKALVEKFINEFHNLWNQPEKSFNKPKKQNHSNKPEVKF